MLLAVLANVRGLVTPNPNQPSAHRLAQSGLRLQESLRLNLKRNDSCSGKRYKSGVLISDPIRETLTLGASKGEGSAAHVIRA